MKLEWSQGLIAAVVVSILAALLVWVVDSIVPSVDANLRLLFAVLPFLAFGVFSGAIRQFKGAGIEIGFKEAADQEVSAAGHETLAEQVAVPETTAVTKGSTAHLADKIEAATDGKPVVLTMTLGAGAYTIPAMSAYIRRFQKEQRRFRFVVLQDPKGRFAGTMDAERMRDLLESDQGATLIDAINTDDRDALRGFDAYVETSVRSNWTNAQTLSEMVQSGVGTIAVTDPKQRFLGMVTRDELLSRIMVAGASAK